MPCAPKETDTVERLFWGNNVFGKFKTRIFLSIFFFPARRKMFLIDKKESSFSKEKRYYYQLNITACIPRCCFIKPKPSGFDNRSNSIHPYFPNRSSQSATLLETTPPPHPEEPRIPTGKRSSQSRSRQKRPTPSMYLHPPWYQCN